VKIRWKSKPPANVRAGLSAEVVVHLDKQDPDALVHNEPKEAKLPAAPAAPAPPQQAQAPVAKP
jgi:hypothetical protein